MMVILLELSTFIYKRLLVFELGVAPFRVESALIIAEGIGWPMATWWPLHWVLITVVGFIASLLEDIACDHDLRVLYDSTWAVFGVEDVDMLIAPTLWWYLLLTVNTHLHLEI
jgi:hypothetical protein